MSPELENDMSNTYRYLKFEVVEGVATITLNRPGKMNAFTFTLGDELSNAYARCDADDDIQVVILTGAGSAFCAGADMEGGSDTFSNTDGRLKKTEKIREGVSRIPGSQAGDCSHQWTCRWHWSDAGAAVRHTYRSAGRETLVSLCALGYRA